MLILSRGTHFLVVQYVTQYPTNKTSTEMFRLDLKIGDKLSIPKKRILFQLLIAWFNGLIAQRRLVEVGALFR